MKLIIGLGNPGRKFQKTRHNLGFRVIDVLKKRNNFSKFELKRELNFLISKGKFNNKKIILAKPQTFMNESGKAVKLLVTHYKLRVTNLFVVHDDIDLPLGKIRIVKNRGAAGHRGIQSIIDELGTKNFIRFRIGIRRRKTETGSPSGLWWVSKNQKLEKFVLQKFTKEEEKILKEVIKRTCQAIEVAIKEEAEKAMSKYNQ